MIIFLSLKCFSLFPFGIIDWIFKNIPVTNEGEVRWVRVRTQWRMGRSERTCAYDGKKGVKFLPFWYVSTN